ncbi:hypothetical protein CYY_003456 [Polysphondylium violaceum]|uniref:F-box domain-containing protein n=1 Tax=Polysphondylium violaceum TaxID=133409 RepID=A0A8J4V175_9MYCE|nr:hypothetical protein CYY_003456 [Polysphondylium violaceum]
MQYVNGYEIVKTISDEVRFIFTNPNLVWTEVAEYEGCKAFYLNNPRDDGLLFKCVADIDCSPEIPFNVVFHTELQSEWDDLCIKAKRLDVLDSFCSVDYFQFANLIGGYPKGFTLLRNFSIDYDMKACFVACHSVEYDLSSQEFHQPSTILNSLRPSGWYMQEIAPNKTRLTVMSQLPDIVMTGTTAKIDPEQKKKIYQNTSIKGLYIVPNLIKYIKEKYLLNNQPSPTISIKSSPPPTTAFQNSHRKLSLKYILDHIMTLPDHDRFLKNKDISEIKDQYIGPMDIFKSASEKIGEFENANWSLFRKINDFCFYYRDFDHESVDYVMSGSFHMKVDINTLLEYIITEESHVVDSWMYGAETVAQFDDISSVVNIRYHSVLDPANSVSSLILKQVNNIPIGGKFIGFRSLVEPDMPRDNFWFYPSGYYISPSETGGVFLRYFLSFRAYLPTELKKVTSKQNILLCISEKGLYTMTQLKNIQYKSATGGYIDMNPNFPHWTNLKDRPLKEVVDFFATMNVEDQQQSYERKKQKIQQEEEVEKLKIKQAAAELRRNETEIGVSYPDIKGVKPFTNLIKLAKEDKKRKLEDHGDIALSFPTSKFTFKNPDEVVLENSNSSNELNSNSNEEILLSPTTSIHSSISSGSLNSLDEKLASISALEKDFIYFKFTKDWDKDLVRKPFFLLMASEKSNYNPPRKSPRSNQYPNLTNSLFDFLPDEILFYILSFLDTKSLSRLSLTCKFFLTYTNNCELLWKELFNRNYKSSTQSLFRIDLMSSLNHMNTMAATNSENRTFNICKTVDRDKSKEEIKFLDQVDEAYYNYNTLNNNWRNVCVQKEIIKNNWKNSKPKISLMRGHKSAITCIQQSEENLFSGSRDRDFKIWNLSTKHSKITKDQSNASVVSFEKDCFTKLADELFPYCLYDPSMIRIGYSNGYIHNYNMYTKKSIEQRFVYVADGFLFKNNNALIWEGTNLQMWDQETSSREFECNLDTKINRCKLSGTMPTCLFLACSDKTLSVFDLKTNQIIRTFNGHTASVNCLDFMSEYQIVTGSSDKTIRIWDIRVESELYTLKSHKSKIKCLGICGSTIASGDSNSILVWDINNSNNSSGNIDQHIPRSTFKVNSSVECLTIDNETMVAGLFDGNISYFDFFN